MTSAQITAAARALPADERRKLLAFLLDTVTDFAREYADDMLRLVADALDNLVASRPALIRLAVGFGTKLLRFAAERIEAQAG